MKIPAIVRLCFFTISIISLIFLPKTSLKKYLPVSIFTSTLVLFVCALAIPYKFWSIKGGLWERVWNDFSFVFGPFFAGTLWIFHLTYGKFIRYIGINSFMNLLLAYPLSTIMQKYNVYKLKNFNNHLVFLTYFAFSFIIYGYQMLIDRSVKIGVDR
ncbi:hypothetical protein QA612_17500 [Evansella sp. AB-P1]|uniref:hypothetical protein n=1 Tax=Evansella sp. AB-P1 TaxID=3037653 RepID=UPI00241C5618|nr:hypothetical protein [Evansella sp. AB-P1]MDG5789258.1 hypothetical protein [Evansella sp. AB-P1]